MKKLLFISALIVTAVSCAPKQTTTDFTQFVDPHIGSGGHGHVFVGASVPRGLVQLGPVNVSEGWDWCSGYHVSDSTVIGFAHTHLSGTGIGDKGDILFMPVTGNPEYTHKTTYLSNYDKSKEIAKPYYYSTVLTRYNIKAELAATTRVGHHRYTYPEGAAPQMVINMFQGIGWDAAYDCKVEMVNDTTITGYRLSKGWAEDDRVYFSAHFNTPIKSIKTIADTAYNKQTKTTKIVPGAYTFIEFQDAQVVEAKVAISGVDVAGAEKNYVAEKCTFQQAQDTAQEKWNELLRRVEVEGSSESTRKVFYTAFYHTAIFPCIFNDVDGKYRGANGEIYESDRPVYTIFSLWDTYRSAHPLFTITEKEKVADMVNSMLAIYDQQGKLPVWHLWGNETNCMVGFGSVQVIADAIMKNIEGFDYDRAYNAMLNYAELDERGLKQVREQGFIPGDKELESVAKAMEYCISDAAIAAVATKLGKTEDAERFTKRSENYKRYFDKNDNFIKGVLADGSFRTPFDPAFSSHREDDFCEGNSWQYSWMVPHDYKGLFGMFDSMTEAEAKLDSLFSTPYVRNANSSPDISGMVGQYSHGNEPSHSTIFAYAAMGKPEKTAALARKIITELYFDDPNGLSGNEDCGQMSAWYMLNAMGIYQPNPAGGDFVITSPLFTKTTIHLGENKTFVIEKQGTNVYHTKTLIDGKDAPLAELSYAQIENGGTLTLID